MKYEIQRMTSKYSQFKKIKDMDSTPFNMLSELIDNSLGSIEVNNGEFSSLEVLIIIDHDKKEILIKDNAYGMTQKKLEDSIRMDRKPGLSNTFNVHGVGMKNSSFWFGEDLEIWTKRDNSGCLYTSVITSDKNWDDEITWIVEDSDLLKSRGTIVKISNCFNGRMPVVKFFEKDIKPLLESKFSYYIQSGAKIKYKIIKKGNDSGFIALTPFSIKSQIIPINKLNEFKKAMNESFDESKPIILNNLKDLAIKLAEENKELIFEHQFSICEKGPFNLKIGIIDGSDSNFKPFYGVGTTQNRRYINLPGYETGNPFDFPKLNYTRTEIKRVWGIVELGNYFSLDTNKRKFDMSNEERESFLQILEGIGKDIIKIAKIVAVITSTDKKVKAKTVNSDVVVNLNQKSRFDENFKWSKEGEEPVFRYKNKYKFFLKKESIEKGEKGYYLARVKNSPIDDSSFTVYININHTILKPISIDSTSNDMDETFYPLFLILAMADMVKSNKFNEILGIDNSINDKDYFDIVDILLEEIIKI